MEFLRMFEQYCRLFAIILLSEFLVFSSQAQREHIGNCDTTPQKEPVGKNSPEVLKEAQLEKEKIQELRQNLIHTEKNIEELKDILQELRNQAESVGKLEKTSDKERKNSPTEAKVFTPHREIPRPSWKKAEKLALFAGKRFLAVLPRLRGASDTFTIIDKNLNSTQVPFPDECQRLYPMTGISSTKRIYLSEGGCSLGNSPFAEDKKRQSNTIGFYSPTAGKKLQKIKEINVKDAFQEYLDGRKEPSASVNLFEQPTGFGALLTITTRNDKKKLNNMFDSQSWLIDYDMEFKQKHRRRLPGTGGSFCLSAGPEKKTNVIWRANSFAFVDTKGEIYTKSIKPAPGDKLDAPAPGDWQRPGIVPGSEYFAMPHQDQGTLPVFDLTTTPPSQVYSFWIDTGTPSQVVSLISGQWLYAKEGDSETIRGLNLEDKDIERAKYFYQTNLKDGWETTLKGVDAWFQYNYLGYYKGNIIVPGKANIYFLDEKNGEINYRFCMASQPGEGLRPSKEWYRQIWPNWKREKSMGPAKKYYKVVSFEVYKEHLCAVSDKPGTPIYVWKLPKD